MIVEKLPIYFQRCHNSGNILKPVRVHVESGSAWFKEKGEYYWFPIYIKIVAIFILIDI